MQRDCGKGAGCALCATVTGAPLAQGRGTAATSTSSLLSEISSSASLADEKLSPLLCAAVPAPCLLLVRPGMPGGRCNQFSQPLCPWPPGCHRLWITLLPLLLGSPPRNLQNSSFRVSEKIAPIQCPQTDWGPTLLFFSDHCVCFMVLPHALHSFSWLCCRRNQPGTFPG